MDRIIRAMHREWSGLHEAAFLLAGTALLSQVLGLVRDRLLAHRLGAGSELDVYYAAFRIPDLLYASLASFVAVTVLIPFLLNMDEEGTGKEKKHFIDTVFTVFVAAIVIVAGALYALMPHLAGFVVPGFSPELRLEFIELSRILLLSPVLLGLSNLFGAVTQSLRKFFVFALGPVLYNIGIILGVVFLMESKGMHGVVYGVVLGALLHLLIQLPVLYAHGLVPRFTLKPSWRIVHAVSRLSIARTVALSATHLASMVLIALASRVDMGAIAVFMLAMNLQSIPLTIVGMSYSVAAFPTLAKLWVGGEREHFIAQVATATRHIFFWSFPAILLFIVLRAQIVRSFLGSGAFDWTATRLTAAALALFAISVVAQNLVLLYTRAFYAMGKTRVTVYTNVAGALTIVFAALMLERLFASDLEFRFFLETLLRVSDLPGTLVIVYPLAYSIGMIVNVLLLFIALRVHAPELRTLTRKSFLHSFAASVVMGFVAYHSLQVFANLFDLNSFIGIASQGVLSGLLGVIAGIFLLYLMENKEIEEIRISLHHKFWKAKPIANEQESL